MKVVPIDVRSSRNPDYPAGPTILNGILSGQMFSANTAESVVRNAANFGDLVHFSVFGRHVYQLNHPDLVSDFFLKDAPKHHRGVVMQRAKGILGEGLLTSEEPLHMRQRRLAQPAFLRQRIAAYGEIISSKAVAMTSTWQSGTVVDIHGEISLTAMRIVGKCLFDLDLDAEIKKISAAIDAFMGFLPLALIPFSERVQQLPIPAMVRIRRSKVEMDKMIYGIIRERSSQPGDRGDLLSMLMASVDTEGDTGKMSATQVRDECLTVMLAGLETTANALSFALWLLAHHPQIQQRMYEECRETLDDRVPGAADYAGLRYTETIFAEAMRLYPPVWVTARTCVESYEIAGYKIDPGAILLAPQIACHRDPRYWENALEFDPTRFTEEGKLSRPRFSYFPFGAGSRQCIGEGLAWMEGVFVLASIIKDWRLSPQPGSSTKLSVKSAITLRPEKGIHLLLERRN